MLHVNVRDIVGLYTYFEYSRIEVFVEDVGRAHSCTVSPPVRSLLRCSLAQAYAWAAW